MNDDIIRNIIKNNVLVAAEAAELANVSRQQINNLVKKGEIVPIKNTSGGHLFYKPDVEKYVTRKIKNRNAMINCIQGGGSTRNSIRFYEENIQSRKDEITAIFIYFEKCDAIMDGFYKPYKQPNHNELVGLQSPSFVVSFLDGTEYWLDGLTCGYGGEGPGGSVEVLCDIGVDEKEIKKLYHAKWVKYFREEDGWQSTVEIRDVFKEKERSNEEIEEVYFKEMIKSQNLSAKICLFNGHLALVQEKRNMGWWEYRPSIFLNKYFDFIGNPSSITLYSTERAIATGHYRSTQFEEQFFRIVIKGENGREMWLDHYIDENMPISRQDSIKELFEKLGIQLKENELSAIAKNALHIRPIVYDYTYPVK